MSQTCSIIAKQIELDLPGDDGSTLRQHLEQFRKMSGIKDDRLQDYQIPYICNTAYSAFCKLRRGEDPISYSEIKAYIEVTGEEISSREVDAIMKFDNSLLNTKNDIIRKHAMMRVEKK